MKEMFALPAMMRLTTLAAAAACLLVGAALGMPTGDPTWDNPESCDLAKAERDLTQVYGEVLKKYTSDAEFVRKMRASERAWLKYRDAALEARFPLADKPGQYGSAYPMCLCAERVQLTEFRVTELRRWLNGAEEGDVCSGSIRFR